jgi:hypothetical protein
MIRPIGNDRFNYAPAKPVIETINHVPSLDLNAPHKVAAFLRENGIQLPKDAMRLTVEEAYVLIGKKDGSEERIDL